MFVWLALMTGARRGELCALTWDRLDFAAGVLTIRSSIAQTGAKTWEKHTKTHQQRRITLDDGTIALLRAYRQRRAEQAALLGFEVLADARIFSLSPDGSTWLKPDSVGQRYARMCARLGWDMNLHQLRHYSATELIAAGVAPPGNAQSPLSRRRRRSTRPASSRTTADTAGTNEFAGCAAGVAVRRSSRPGTPIRP